MYVCMCVCEVIIGNSSNPIRGLVFDSVVVENPGSKPWGDDFYFCKNDGGVQVTMCVCSHLYCICMYACMYVYRIIYEHLFMATNSTGCCHGRYRSPSSLLREGKVNSGDAYLIA